MSYFKLIGMFARVILLMQISTTLCQDTTTLPDSIPQGIEMNCAEMLLELDNAAICCEMNDEQEPTQFFCTLQCFNGLCRCVNRTTGDPLNGIVFPFDDESEADPCDMTPSTTPPPPAPTPPTTTITEDPPGTTVPEPEESTTGESDSQETDEEPTDEEPTDESCDEESSSSRESGDSTGTSSRKRTSGTKSSSTKSSSGRSDCSRSSSSSRSGSSSSSSRSSTTKSSKSSSRSSSRSTKSSKSSSGSSSRSTKSSKSSSRSTSSSKSSKSGSRRSSSSYSRRCTTVTRLLYNGCIPSCLRLDGRCPVCSETCTNLSGKWLSRRDCNCTDSQVCIRGGLFGLFQCANRPGIGEMCEIGDEGNERTSSKRRRSAVYRRFQRKRGRIVGEREKVQYRRLGDVDIECQNGMVCIAGVNDTATCQLENQTSACVEAHMQDPSITCTATGQFERLQCREEGTLTICQCVQPDSGEAIPATQVVVVAIEDIPSCDILDLRSCMVEVGGVVTGVSHGDSLVDPDNCRSCRCDNGSLVDCQTPRMCKRISRSPSSCTYRNHVVHHRQRFRVGCGTCGCYNGRIRCSRKQCRDIRDECASCERQGYSPVCGLNGVTYPSRCHAVFCEGQIPFKLFRGRCIDNDVCSRYPCNANETCVKRGGVTCIGDCKAEDLRLCVDISKLTCSSDEENDTKLCATNGITYSSLCRLLQDSKGESVAYVGECNSIDCSGGQVCGTDGITYDNICALRSLASNVRLDYKGECLNEEGVPVGETCSQVLERQLCKFNSDNCKSLIQPADGCCPICGGLVIIAIDIAGIREYITINPVASDFDSLFEQLVESSIFSRNTTSRCDVEFTIVNRNIQLTLSARTPEDEEFCQDEGMRIAEVLNDPQAHIAFLPDVMQFATATVAFTPEVTESIADKEPTTNSAAIFSAMTATLIFNIFITVII